MTGDQSDPNLLPMQLRGPRIRDHAADTSS